MEVLNRLLKKARELELLSDIVLGIDKRQVKVSHLFFVDDYFK